MISTIKNIKNITAGFGSVQKLSEILEKREGFTVFIIDIFFKKNKIFDIPANENDIVVYVDSTNELTTTYINELMKFLKSENPNLPQTIVGIGGGTALDTAKAVSNLYTNPGNAEDYQGWDLVKNAGIYKIGIPTLSGTGAESSRTCVMIRHQNKLKLGMNSNHTIYDELILDPDLTASVPKEQYFYSGADAYIHSFESLNGRHRNNISDAYAHRSMELCREVFLSSDMKSPQNREKLMTASYFGGVAIANSLVGVVHPLSAGLSVVFDIHHCLANCITMNAMEEFYPIEYKEFNEMLKIQNIEIPKGKFTDLSPDKNRALYEASIIHEKPLINALGENFKEILTFEKVKSLFRKM